MPPSPQNGSGPLTDPPQAAANRYSSGQTLVEARWNREMRGAAGPRMCIYMRVLHGTTCMVWVPAIRASSSIL